MSAQTRTHTPTHTQAAANLITQTHKRTQKWKKIYFRPEEWTVKPWWFDNLQFDIIWLFCLKFKIWAVKPSRVYCESNLEGEGALRGKNKQNYPVLSNTLQRVVLFLGSGRKLFQFRRYFFTFPLCVRLTNWEELSLVCVVVGSGFLFICFFNWHKIPNFCLQKFTSACVCAILVFLRCFYMKK